MFLNSLRAVAVLCCVLAFACSSLRADDVKPMLLPVPPGASDGKPTAQPQDPKFPTVIRLEILEPGEALTKLARSFPPGAIFSRADIEPLLDDKALLVYADAKTTQEIRDLLLLLGEPEKKHPHVIPVADVLNVDEVAKAVKKKFPAKTVICPLSEDRALLAYVTDTQAKEIREIIRVCIEKEPAQPPTPMALPKLPGPVQLVAKPAAERTYTVYFERAKWEDVFAWYEKISELKADVRVKPTGVITLKPRKDRRFTTGEITDLLNEALAQQKLLLLPGQRTFTVVSGQGKLDPKFVPAVDLKDLPRLPRTAIVEVMIPVPIELEEEVVGELKLLLTPFGEILFAKRRWLIVRDTVGNINRIREVLEGPCCSMEPPFKFPFNVKEAKWDDVFKKYAELTGLRAVINSKPPGTFTFTPPKAPEWRLRGREPSYTLAEITDAINDALLAKNHLLIRRHMTFVVVPADEKIDPTLVPRIELKELDKYGRTELVQVIIPVHHADILDVVDEVKKLSGPFGGLVPHKNMLIVTDTAANVLKIRKKINELTAEKK